MLYTLEDLTYLAEREVGPGLVPPRLWQEVRGFSPLFATSLMAGCVECRLASGAPRVDFWTALSTQPDGRQAITRHLASQGGTEAWTRSPAWDRARAFLESWTDPDSPLFGQVETTCVELDFVGGRAEEIAPIVFFRLRRGLSGSGGTASQEQCRIPQAVPVGAAILGGRSLDEKTLASLRRCYDALPQGAYVLHVAPMCARGVDTMRIMVVVPRRRIPAYLEAIGWRGPQQEIATFLDTTAAFQVPLGLDIDVGREGVGPRLGVEFDQVCAATVDRRWAPLWQLLVNRGIASRERQEILLGWPPRPGASPTCRTGPFYLHKELLLKVSFEAEKAPEGKAYLTFLPRVLSRSCRTAA